MAESAAFVVLNHYRIDRSGYSFPYVARRAQDKPTFRQNLDAVQHTVHTIIENLEGHRNGVVRKR